MEVLKILHDPEMYTAYQGKFLEESIIQSKQTFEDLISMTVSKTLIDPYNIQKRKELEEIDPDVPSASSVWKLAEGAPATQLSATGIPLNLIFSESSLTHNLKEQLE